MIICGVFFFLGWSLIASSYNVIQLFVGRALTGEEFDKSRFFSICDP